MKQKQVWLGALPAALVAALLVTAALSPRAAGRAPSMPGALAYPNCDNLLQQGGGADPIRILSGAGVIQPIAFVGNVAACSLTVDHTYSGAARLDLVQWDPAALAPDPTTVALRTRSFDVSALQYGWTRADFYPPVVIRSVDHVSEPPRQTTAMVWTAAYDANLVRFDSNGPPEVPGALEFPPGGTPRIRIPTAHPVLSHAVCGGDGALQDLQVIQSVMTTTSLSDTMCFDLIQRFRVPARSRLHWVEVAFGVNPHPVYYDPIIAILDADGAAEPPVSLPPSLVEASYLQYVVSPFWGSHYDFDHLITLEPGHDYWLLARVEHRYLLYKRDLTGAESADFSANIGPLFWRAWLGSNWVAEPSRSLCFRMIGEALGGHPQPHGRLRDRPLGEADPGAPPPHAIRAAAAGAPSAEPGAGPFRLGVAPNPVRGAAFVSWSGAKGPLRVDVFDAQGRRVAGATDTGADGKWLWSGARDDGRPLPAGVYIVRASDGAGRVATDRAVLIR